MNKYLPHVHSVENNPKNELIQPDKPRSSRGRVIFREGRLVTGKFKPNYLNKRFDKSLVAFPKRRVVNHSSVYSLLDKKHICTQDLKVIKSGSVVISIMDGKLRVMDGSSSLYEKSVSYRSLSYARSIKANSMVIATSATNPFGFVSSVFDDNGPVCFWRTMKCDDSIVLIFWGDHEQE